MYEKLISSLRICQVMCEGSGFEEAAKLLTQAADAIEELSAYVRQIEELRKDGYYLQKTKMMTYGQATMTRPLPEPPREET